MFLFMAIPSSCRWRGTIPRSPATSAARENLLLLYIRHMVMGQLGNPLFDKKKELCYTCEKLNVLFCDGFLREKSRHHVTDLEAS